jgi:hypothetical protein
VNVKGFHRPFFKMVHANALDFLLKPDILSPESSKGENLKDLRQDKTQGVATGPAQVSNTIKN